uniref:cytochrome c oxidase subunit 3 n=1 Tax=uncultured Gimesia sp. TaxID=1678688 RepID=UPI00263487DB
VGTLVFLWNIWTSLRNGKIAGDNPWDAFTLEWATTSPPPPENFDTLPEIKSRRPVWDQNHPEHADWKSAQTPPDNGKRFNLPKLAAWAFIASEAVFFLLLLVAFVVFNTRHRGGEVTSTVLDVERTGIFSLFLISSSVTFWLAERFLKAGKRSMFIFYLGITILFGTIFLAGQVWEYAGLLTDNVTINTDLFTATFFTITGFHGIHVTAGVIALLIMLIMGVKGNLTSKKSHVFGAVGIYWHFVDIVWLAVFGIIYLGLLQ